jgi:hypothetical protein
MVEATLRIPLVAAAPSGIVTFEDNSIIAANRDLLCCDLSEGAVILDLKTGIYYGLDTVGTFIWGLIQSPMHLGDIATAVLAEYAVEHERCMADLKKIFTEMAELNLIEVTK